MQYRFLRKSIMITSVGLFVIITVIFLAKPYYQHWQKTKGASLVSYCDLTENASVYQEKLVCAKASIYGTSEHYFYLAEKQCNAGLGAELTRLYWTTDSPIDQKQKTLLEKISAANDDPSAKVHEVIITGCFRGKVGDGCWSPAYAMKVIDIELAS